MKEQDKKEIREIFNEGIEQLVLPRLDEILDKQDEHSKILEEHTKILEGHGQDLDRIERKIDAEISWRDDASKRLKQVEIELGLTE